MSSWFKFSYLPILFLFAGVITFPFLGEINLFDWDETMIASVSKEMFHRDEILQPYLNGTYFLEKPPFFFWTQLISYKYLGINEYAARFPNAVCLLFVVLTLYKNGKRLYSSSFGMMWAMIYLSILLAQFYHKSGLVEPWFNFFIYLALYNISRVIEMRQERGEGYYRSSDISIALFYAAFATSGAILTKGIEGFIILFSTYILLFLFSSAKYGIGFKNFFKWVLFTALFISIWVSIEFKWHGIDYIESFYKFQLAELNLNKVSLLNKVTLPLVILLVGCFPASVLALNSLNLKTYESTIQKVFRLAMASSLIVSLIIVTFFKSKLIHYASYTYFPISFLAAYSIRYIFEEKAKLSKLTWSFLVTIGLIWTAVLVAVPATRANISFLGKYIQDDTLQSALMIVYPWQQYEIYIGISYFLIFLIVISLLVRNYYRSGLILLFFSTMIYSEIILLYYVPKLEQLTQGPQVDFVKQNEDQKAKFFYHNGKSYIPQFYLNYNYIQPEKYSFFEIINKEKCEDPIYIIKKKNDTSLKAEFAHYTRLLYSQGIYSFYKLK